MAHRLLAELASPDVASIAPDTPVRAGLDLMRRRGISCLVVESGGRPIGIVTERTILWAAAHKDASFPEWPVCELMSSPVITVSEDDNVVEACALLTRNRLRHLVMVDAAGRTKGIITQSNLIRCLGEGSLYATRRVSEIMTREVVAAAGTASAREAVTRMAEGSISCLVVTRDGRPAGIITERDVVRLLLENAQLDRRQLYDIMSCPVVCIEADQPLLDAAVLMKKHRVRRVVVVDDDRKVLGIVTQTDMLKGLASPYVRNLETALTEKEAALEHIGKSLVQKTVFLDNLLRCAEIGIVAVDASWRITYCNPEASIIFALRAEALIGRDLREVHVQYGLDLVTLGHALQQVTPTSSHDFTFSLSPAGAVRRYAARVSGIYDKDGNPDGYVLMVRDDTERLLAEDNLACLTRNLENLVVERTRDLACQAKALEQANLRLRGQDEIKSAFLSSVSHELRTPLTSLLGFSKLIARDFSRYFTPLAGGDRVLTQKAARIEENLAVLAHEGERLARLLNDFLDLSRIESGRMRWRDRRVDLAELVTKTVSAAAGLFASRPEVDLETRLPDVAPVVVADPDRLEQVLINLIDNAAKFTAVGAVTVSLCESEPGVARISVVDTGPGVAEEDRELIFDKFRQVRRDPEGASPVKGTGLGLAICREIVTHYEGRIWVEPAPGRGAAFLFELPTTQADPCVQAKPAPPQGRPLALVVDDDPAISAFFIQFLEAEGFRVASAHDGASALSAAAKLRPSIITMDLAMPGMDGKTAIAALRANPELAGIPILAVTGHEEDVPDAVDAVLTKPVLPEALLRTIRALLGRPATD